MFFYSFMTKRILQPQRSVFSKKSLKKRDSLFNETDILMTKPMIPLYLVSSVFYVIHNILSVIYTCLSVIYNNRHTELSTIVDNLWITLQQADT